MSDRRQRLRDMRTLDDSRGPAEAPDIRTLDDPPRHVVITEPYAAPPAAAAPPPRLGLWAKFLRWLWP